jgi:hypothetical protein
VEDKSYWDTPDQKIHYLGKALVRGVHVEFTASYQSEVAVVTIPPLDSDRFDFIHGKHVLYSNRAGKYHILNIRYSVKDFFFGYGTYLVIRGEEKNYGDFYDDEEFLNFKLASSMGFFQKGVIGSNVIPSPGVTPYIGATMRLEFLL